MAIPAAAETRGMHVHSAHIRDVLPRPAGDGWRVEVNLRKGWRWVRRYAHKREATAYRPLHELPAGRVERAREESARQRRLKGRAAR